MQNQKLQSLCTVSNETKCIYFNWWCHTSPSLKLLYFELSCEACFTTNLDTSALFLLHFPPALFWSNTPLTLHAPYWPGGCFCLHLLVHVCWRPVACACASQGMGPGEGVQPGPEAVGDREDHRRDVEGPERRGEAGLSERVRSWEGKSSARGVFNNLSFSV